MERDLSCWRRSMYLALGLVLGGQGLSLVQGQIVLHPSPGLHQLPQNADYEGYSRNSNQGSSRRLNPAVRNDALGLQPQTLNQAVESGSANRDAEYQLIRQEADALDRQLGLIRRIVKFASPSIVHIEATKSSDAGKGFATTRIEEAGAGVVISLRGGAYVLTNRHVIHPADINSIRLELNDGRRLRPLDVWTDPSTDVAVIQVDDQNLTHAVLGNSDALEIGDFVLAVGSPFGLSHSVTYGILSAKGRRNLELGAKEIEIQDFFQTDAAINPGNSGGPLLNLRGEIIGINTAIASNSGGNEGIGFSIPINMAMIVAEQLVSHGRLMRSQLGVVLENVFDMATARRLGLVAPVGALVKSIKPDSPAARAGIQVGDVIVEFDGHRVENDGHLVKTVGLTPLGSTVNVIIYRNGAASRVTAVLAPSQFE